ncbi:phosphate-regulating neutral endopeptidase PHEX-like [Musca vetustissima]|uniref:phosphate-regulating neutral endopeptidase PHEX-like n=1 Tax=Musca vetustissima TaxID=27455 RepID=UPI002AB7B5CB|nr:phosphate-regulating neutral endopeptidase PHEX-like [Musca vetustissima]
MFGWRIFIFLIVTFCYGPELVQASVINVNKFYEKLIKANVNESVDPCENFYEYACGNWHRNYDDGKGDYIDMPGYMDYKVNQQYRELLEKGEEDRKWKTGIFKKAKALYDACENVEHLVLNQFLAAVEEELQMEWPIFSIESEEEWLNVTRFDWLHVLAVLRRYGMNGIFLTHNVNVNPRNSKEYFLEVSQHYDGSVLLESEDVENIFINFGMDHNASHQLTEEIMEFERALNELAKIVYLNETDTRNYADNFQQMKLKELQESVPEIDWLKYFQIVLNETRREYLQNLTIQTFAVTPEFFSNLKEHLQSYSNETIGYYIMLKFMYYINGNLPHGSQRNCIKYVRSFMPVFMNYLYEETLFKNKRQEIEESLQKMFQNLKNSFESLVKENHLKLDSQEQNFILKELHHMQLKIGNLPRNCSEDFVENFYNDLKVNSSNFIDTHLSVLKFMNELHYRYLEQKSLPIADKVYHFDTSSLSSSSPVKIFDNAILVPHGYLQLPLYDTQLNHLHQYSLLGFILAHEIIHAYDLFHIIYDHESNYDYLGSKVAHHFSPHLKCYSQSTRSDIASENIADVAGLRVAYNYYQTISDDHGMKFPFLHLTKDQYFFVNSVQFLCADIYKIAALGLETTADLAHDMHDKRVQQNWSKFEEFSLAFNCSPKSNMSTPVESCRIW